MQRLDDKKVQALRAIAEDFHNLEKGNASRILAKYYGIYIDIAGIQWTRTTLRTFSKPKREYMFGFEPLP